MSAVIAVCAINLLFAKAASPQGFTIETYSGKNGLPQSLVLSILQDDQGYIWFGTWNGICKFDGKVFTSYKIGDTQSSNSVMAMMKDTDGNLWIGTYGGGVSRFDGETWQTFTTQSGLVDNYVTSIFQDSRGYIWFGTEGKGVSRYDGKTWRTFTTEIGLIDFHVKSIIQARDGNLWFGSAWGFSKYDGQTWVRYTSDAHGDENSVNTIFEDSKGNLWIGTAAGAGKFNGSEWKAFDKNAPLSGITVNSILEDKDGDIWFATREGVFRFDGNNWTSITEKNGLPNNETMSVFEDREGNIWVCTLVGVCRLVKTPFLNFSVNTGLADNICYPFLEDKNGNLWLGTYKSGAVRYDGKRWTNFTVKDGLGSNRILYILEDHQGKLWFGTWHGGVARFDGRKWKILSRENGLGDITVFTIFEDSHNNLWFGTSEGVTKFDGQKWSTLSQNDGLAHNEVYAIQEDKEHNMWFGTFGGGISAFNGQEWKTWNTDHGLPSNHVLSFYKDTEGNIWIGTLSGGVSKYDGISFTNYTTADGLSDNNCYSIIQDNGNFFFGTNKGLNRFDGRTFRVYTTRDGLPSDALHRGAVKDRHGCLWFGTNAGLSKYDPKLDKPNLIPPPIYISKVSTFNNKVVKNSFPLEHNENDLRFDYVGLCFAAPEALIYSYILEGFDRGWQISTSRTVQYTNLPTGNYTFKVKAMNRDFIWSEAPSEFNFSITPPFWNTWWFRVLALAVLLGLILGVFKYWHKRKTAKELKEKNLELEKALELLNQEVEERRRAEESLRRTELEKAVILDSMTDCVLFLDPELRIIWCNKTVCKAIGLSPGEIVGRLCREVLTKEHSGNCPLCPIKISSETGEVYEEERVTPNGNVLFERCYPIKDDHGKVIGIVDIWRDITGQKLLQEQLGRAQKMESLGLLASGVAHDLNNILTGLVSYPDLILMQLARDDPLREFIQTIKDSGQRAAEVVQDLLTLARRGVISMRVLNLNDIVNKHLTSPEFDYIKILRPNVKFEKKLEKGLLNIQGSEVHLLKTLMNLLTNAVEALPQGGTVTISTSNKYIDKPVKGYDMVQEGDYAVLTVADDGIGIPAEDMKRIFEPFYTKKVMGRSGSGLGMAVVWGTVKDLHGYIDITSTEGEGTTFNLYFPVTREEAETEQDSVSVENYLGRGEKILVVDDVQEQRLIASNLLSKLGYRVATVSSGEQAIEYLKSNAADLLILDMIMDPGIDGLETYQRIIEIKPKQKAIIASGFAETERVKTAQKLGAGAYLQKPYTLQKLGLLVSRELGR